MSLWLSYSLITDRFNYRACAGIHARIKRGGGRGSHRLDPWEIAIGFRFPMEVLGLCLKYIDD